MIETQVIENFVHPMIADKLENTVKTMPFYFNDATGYPDQYTGFADNKTLDSTQMTHIFINDMVGKSDWLHILNPMIDALYDRTKAKGKVARCKMNMTYPSFHHEGGKYMLPHLDIAPRFDAIVGLYYINDSDGNTLFFKGPQHKDDEGNFIIEREVTPKKNTMVIFDASVMHCNRPPRLTNNRWVINFLIYKNEII